jgi:hypothetical protein
MTYPITCKLEKPKNTYIEIKVDSKKFVSVFGFTHWL